jgi:hypothetical protein
MTTDSRFSRFLANLTLSSDQLADAQTKYDGVAKKLHDHYYTTTFSGSTRKLIGSYGKGTAVRPPRDVDILFLLPSSEYDRYKKHTGNAQSQLLQAVRQVLLTKYSSTAIRGDGQVVVIPFSNGHTVELLPGWRSTNGKFIVPNTHDGGSWQTVDHDAEITQVEASDKRSKGNTRILIKMLKAWQKECNVPIKSVVLELRSVNFMRRWEHFEKGPTYYDWMVRDFFDQLVEYKKGTCKMPGTDEKIEYGDAWLSKAESALSRAKKACTFETKKDERSAAEEWRKIFGTQYGF